MPEGQERPPWGVPIGEDFEGRRLRRPITVPDAPIGTHDAPGGEGVRRGKKCREGVANDILALYNIMQLAVSQSKLDGSEESYDH